MDGRDGGGAGEAGMGDPELNRRARRFTSGSRDHHKDACNGPRSRTEVHAGPGSGWGCLRVTDQMEGDMGVIFGFLPLLVSAGPLICAAPLAPSILGSGRKAAPVIGRLVELPPSNRTRSGLGKNVLAG